MDNRRVLQIHMSASRGSPQRPPMPSPVTSVWQVRRRLSRPCNDNPLPGRLLMVRLVVAAVLLGLVGFFLSGCTSTLVETALFAPSMGEKSVADQTATWVTGKDCTLSKRTARGAWCREYVTAETDPAAGLYCYRTLGAVDCFDRPDPFAQGAVPVVTPTEKKPLAATVAVTDVAAADVTMPDENLAAPTASPVPEPVPPAEAAPKTAPLSLLPSTQGVVASH